MNEGLFVSLTSHSFYSLQALQSKDSKPCTESAVETLTGSSKKSGKFTVCLFMAELQFLEAYVCINNLLIYFRI